MLQCSIYDEWHKIEAETMLQNKNHENTDLRYREAGEWFRNQRQHWQITQTELAEQAGNGEASLIEGIEQGEVALPCVMQVAIARAFDLESAALASYCETWYGQKTARAA
jgi:hypothetical protein